ncbi:calcium-activated chloride channel regulator 1-like [Bombina bombina]|uniref:calcium-activated chloride channel regulator 1-like n=1 Tax=Bombina bombina TaxID=8345 RepID=UPI00235ABAE4|nr:calcium-activated chloride channel regulator 1-like [Bombina bombina]
MLKNMLNEATIYLFYASKKRLFIKDAKILIPKTWSSSKNYARPKTETYNKADVIIADYYLNYGDNPYTLQYGGCGKQGKYIHLTPNFMVLDNLSSVYGTRGRVFVHEWARYRWGIFEEHNTEKPFYISGERNTEATRCSVDISGVYTKQECKGTSCTNRNCDFVYETGLYEEGCVFVPEKNRSVAQSIMYTPAIYSVNEFCNESNHNIEAPNLQNRLCNCRSTWDIIANSADIKSSPPIVSTLSIPAPAFSLMQSRDRVITLLLDVSGSMTKHDRIGRMYQAADIFLTQIVETGSYVGIVEFSSYPFAISQLTHIFSKEQRKKLKTLVPFTNTNSASDICPGILSALQVNRKLDGTCYGTEIILVTDGADEFDTKRCFPDILDSGATIHIVALGSEAPKELEQIANLTGGSKYFVNDKLDSNDLIDAFSGIQSENGDITQKVIQLESAALNLKPNKCWNGTIFIDSTVGNDTFILVTWQSSVPAINVRSPTGLLLTVANFSSDSIANLSRVEIQGTAERGSWFYKICNQNTSNQAIGIIATSKAADENVPPITVTAYMDKGISQYPDPMVVYVCVGQGHLPVTEAKVTAIIQSESGNSVALELLDNGAGADIIKNDGIYSRYFFQFIENGRYSLKVRVESIRNASRLSTPRNRALYIPGYVENGKITMNPPDPSVSDNGHHSNLGPFSRTASGGSFVVSNVPSTPKWDIYKPEKITDLEAKIEKNTVVLTWTATGQNLDQGTASSYDLKMSTNPRILRDWFDNCTSINISGLTPQLAGSIELFRFVPENVVIENGTILYFAVVAFNKVFHRSEQSNIAQAALLIPPAPTPSSSTSLQKSTMQIVYTTYSHKTPILNDTTSQPPIPNATTSQPPTPNDTTSQPPIPNDTTSQTPIPNYTTSELPTSGSTLLNITTLTPEITQLTPNKTTQIKTNTTSSLPQSHTTQNSSVSTATPSIQMPNSTTPETNFSITAPTTSPNSSFRRQSKTVLVLVLCLVAICQSLVSIV